MISKLILDKEWPRRIFHEFRRKIAKVWLKMNPGVEIIGVTGSYGKTNTVWAIGKVLSERYKTLQTDLNLDTIYNLPITILKLRPWHKAMVLEYGVDHKNEMDFHLELVKPKIGVLTGITPVHADSEHFGSLENILNEKTKLLSVIPSNGWIIINWDDENIRKIKIKTSVKIVKYGTSKKADFWAEKIKVDLSGTSFFLCDSQEKIPLKISLLGRHFVHSALAAFIIGKIFGLSKKEIISGLKKLRPLKGRMSLEKGPQEIFILDDHLRANLASTLAGLRTLSDIPCRRRKIAVLGEMGEMGKYAKEGHRLIGEEIAKLRIDYLISVGPLQRETFREAVSKGMRKDSVFWAKDVKEAAGILKKILRKEDLLYLKGSLLRHMERVILILKGERVDCVVNLCHFYNPCHLCPNLRKI